MNKNLLKRKLDELQAEVELEGGEGWSPENSATLEGFSEDEGELKWNSKEITSTLHTHSNKEVLDDLGDEEGNLTYKGNPIENGSSNIASFSELTDTPSDYTDSAGKAVVVNSTEDGLEYVDFPENGSNDIASFSDLEDTPSSYGGAGEVVAVNSSADGLEYIPLPPAGASTFVALTDTPSSLGTDGQVLGIEEDMYGGASIVWRNLPDTGGNGGDVSTEDLTDFPTDGSDGQYLTYESDMYGGKDLVWKDLPEAEGNGGESLYYEAGTFVPEIMNVPSGSINTAEGDYHIIGDVLFFNIRVGFSGSHSGAFRVRNFPHPPAGDVERVGFGVGGETRLPLLSDDSLPNTARASLRDNGWMYFTDDNGDFLQTKADGVAGVAVSGHYTIDRS